MSDSVDNQDAILESFVEALDSEEDANLSRIPLLASDAKMVYLSFRATGFSAQQAASLADVNLRTVRTWRRNDDTFRDIEENKLKELQDKAGAEVIRLEFLRTMRLLLRKDFKVIAKTMQSDEVSFQALTEREWEWAKLIRKHYTPGELIKLEQALQPEKAARARVLILEWPTGGTADEPEIDYIDADEVRELASGE